jgi:two-component system sensor histidine kinase ChvG
MAIETEDNLRSEADPSATPMRQKNWIHPVTLVRRIFGHLIFSSLTRRILFLNLAALIVLVSGILYLNQFREGLIDARVESLLTQGEIIAGAVAASASVETNSITIDPEKLLELQAGQTISADRFKRKPGFSDQPGARRAGAQASDIANPHPSADL